MKNCEKCRFRGIYDKNPKSFLGRIWKWHIGWCPGWKSYLKSLSAEERDQLKKRYSSLWRPEIRNRGGVYPRPDH